jgi:hypothetical protein
MTVRYVARAEGLRPITCNHGHALEKVRFRCSDCLARCRASHVPSILSKFCPRTFLSKPGEPNFLSPATSTSTTTGTTHNR